eukprot:6745429-Pyramimonas_sp.AAC.1
MAPARAGSKASMRVRSAPSRRKLEESPPAGEFRAGRGEFRAERGEFTCARRAELTGTLKPPPYTCMSCILGTKYWLMHVYGGGFRVPVSSASVSNIGDECQAGTGTSKPKPKHYRRSLIGGALSAERYRRSIIGASAEHRLADPRSLAEPRGGGRERSRERRRSSVASPPPSHS